MQKNIRSFKLFIIALIVWSNAFSQSNVYKSFPQVYGSWIVEKWGPLGPGQPGYHSWQKFEALGDTTVGSYVYKKVTVANNTGFPTWNGTTYAIPFGSSTFSFGYRNDTANKKIYYLDVIGGANKDTLWYDFNLNVGDTVKSTYSYFKINGFLFSRVIQSIDSVLICGSYYKRFNFNCNDYESDLVEGIGFLDNFIQTERDNDCPFEPSYVYTTTFSICNITSVESYSGDNQIKLYPNPSSSEIKIGGQLNVSEFSIINNMGVAVLKGTDVASINVSSLVKGIYVISMREKSGNVCQLKFIKE